MSSFQARGVGKIHARAEEARNKLRRSMPGGPQAVLAAAGKLPVRTQMEQGAPVPLNPDYNPPAVATIHSWAIASLFRQIHL